MGDNPSVVTHLPCGMVDPNGYRNRTGADLIM
jgi:hypothetical protein